MPGFIYLCPLIGLFVLPAASGILSGIFPSKVCYGKYGCFNNKPPFNRLLVPLPQPPNKVGLELRLVTRHDRTGRTTIDDHNAAKLHATSYDGSKRTIIIIHGWTENSKKSPWIKNMYNALIANEDVNVIVAGWKEGAQKLYPTAVANTRLVGSMVTELIKFLNHETNNNPSSFHLIGFSLGAQIAGYVGRRLQDVKLGRITGLDPAGHSYLDQHIDVRLDPTDADFVDVIHTDASQLGLGTKTKSGHLDFWPNGGDNQRGCGLLKVGPIGYLVCDHFRAANYYVESISSHCPFRSYRCSNWHQFTRGTCMTCGNNGCPEMGHNAIKYKGLTHGNFYLYTNEDKPYCVHRYATVTFKNNWSTHGRNPQINIHGTKGSTGIIDLPNEYLAIGSEKKFVVPIKMDLGTLTSIYVWNFIELKLNPLGWRPSVRLEIVHGQGREEIYSACYKWTPVYIIPMRKRLQRGIKSCY